MHGGRGSSPDSLRHRSSIMVNTENALVGER